MSKEFDKLYKKALKASKRPPGKAIRPTRLGPGHYFYETTIWVRLHTGEVVPANVHYDIRFMPEWRGPQKWAYDVTGVLANEPDEVYQFSNVSDTPAFTYQDAKESVANSAHHGYESSQWGWVTPYKPVRPETAK